MIYLYSNVRNVCLSNLMS